MKKILLLISFLISFVVAFSQHVPSIVPRAGGSLTVSDSNLFIGNSFRVPIFPDTTTANSFRPSLDSSGKLIYTFDQNAIWYRSNSPRRWVQITGGDIINIFNNSITNVTFISQVDSSVTIEICTGADACDTITFVTNITNIDSNSVHLIDSTHFSICGIDTTDGGSVTVCDTVTIPTQQLYAFQNWTRQSSPGIVEFGSDQPGTSPGLSLAHNTYTNTGYFRFFNGGYTIYNYPVNFYQDQSFMNGSGIVSFKSEGQSLYGSTPNRVRLGVNFQGDTVVNASPFIPGYFTGTTRRFGYTIGPNLTSNGSFGMNQDDSVSKNGGIFFHTTDVTNDEGVSIYSAPSVGGQYVGNLSGYFSAHFKTNGDIKIPFYPSSRSDGYAGKFLTTDSVGNILLSSIPTRDSCGLFAGGEVTADSLLTFDVAAASYALCCDKVFRTTDFDTVQLAEPDTGFLRYDAIVAGLNGIEVVQGDQSTDPEQPQLDSCQILLTYILVIGPHDDTVAASQNICQNLIYDEGTGAPSEFLVASTGPTIDPLSTASVAHGTYALDVGSWTNNQRFTFTYDTTVDLSNVFAIKLYINLKAVLGTAPRIRLDWLHGTTVVTSNFAELGGNGTQFGFSRTVLGYQVVTIPTSAWTFSSQIATTLRVTLINTGSGFYMDWVQQQGCSITPMPTPVNVSFASGNLSPLFTTSVANPTSNITQSFAQINAAPYTVFGNPYGVASPREDFTINLSTPSTIGLLDVERLAPCDEGFFIATVDGVQTCVPNPITDIAQVVVVPPLFIDTLDNDTYDTLSLRYNNGLSMTAVDSSLQFGSSSSTGAPFLHNTYLYGASTYTFDLNDLRFEQDQGANITAANDLTLGLDGNVFTVTGNTQINAITTANWQAGSQVQLIFTGTPTVKNNTAGGAGTATILLAGSVDFTAAANDVLSLVYDGTNWHESARKTSGTISSQTLQQTFNTEVGGSVLTKIDSVLTGSFTLKVITSTSSDNPFAVKATTGDGINVLTTTGKGVNVNSTDGHLYYGITSTGDGIQVYTTSGTGGSFTSTSGVGVVAQSSGTFAGTYFRDASSTNSILSVLQVARTSSGTPAAGMGTQIDLNIETNGGGAEVANRLRSKWTDATSATRTSQFSINSLLSGSEVTSFTVSADGSIQLRPITATAASAITPAEGMMLFVSSTDATFTSIGFWGYQNGAWHAF